MGGGKFEDNHSCYFDGSSDQINLGSSIAYNVHNANYSFSFWFKRYSYGWDRIVSKASVGTNQFILLGDETNKAKIQLECDTDQKRIRTDQHEGLLNKWYHMVITTDGSGGGAFYQNGKFIALETGGGSSNDMDAAMTIDTIGNVNNGWINDLAVYDIDIGTAGAAHLYNSGEPYNHSEGKYASDLINWWRMGDGIGDISTTIKDQEGTVDGTIAADVSITGDVPW